MRRVTLDQAAKRPPAIDLRLPATGARVWSAFWEIERSRQGGYGPQAFTYVEIEAWTRLTAADLAPWQVRALMEMDTARRGAWSEVQEEERGRPDGLSRVVSFSNTAAVERMFDRFGDVRDV
ncbi:hypothetical protein [Methylobacterium sp. ARG-1]|uniref:phage tail assembly chaperone n=1 Tax=Methylobacterium sp. ARG-1 TaxID=1692501 RepID=UPI000681B23C|nr:hypothetical protein [Methylobacterium sp. ARG-1]KNY21594.1 hypothetical protein AKJ13_15180 [Methylobacterium sp. ARG-1]